jgi:hypothetical protein
MKLLDVRGALHSQLLAPVKGRWHSAPLSRQHGGAGGRPGVEGDRGRPGGVRAPGGGATGGPAAGALPCLAGGDAQEAVGRGTVRRLARHDGGGRRAGGGADERGGQPCVLSTMCSLKHKVVAKSTVVRGLVAQTALS